MNIDNSLHSPFNPLLFNVDVPMNPLFYQLPNINNNNNQSLQYSLPKLLTPNELLQFLTDTPNSLLPS